MTHEPRQPSRHYDYITRGLDIYEASFATIRAEADLTSMPPDLATVATRIIHASGDVGIVGDIAASEDLVAKARTALDSGCAIFTDSQMLAQGITFRRFPAGNEVICKLRDPQAVELAKQWGTTRAAAAVSLWDERLDGAVVAVGNAPTALFHLLELMADGGPRPAAIIGMPVGFIGSAESKRALADHRLPDGHVVPWIVVHGRRGGSAMAASTLNALAVEDELA